MKTIEVVPPLTNTDKPDGPVVLVLGFFDGVHRGHQAVIEAGKAEAKRRGLPLALMTFAEHPAIVYGGADEAAYRYLSLPDRKAALMAELGVDLYYIMHFTPEFAALSPQAFVDETLCGLNAAVVVAGFDYTYGKPEIASMAQLADYAHGRFDVLTVPAVTANDQKISSTRIRSALDAGDIDAANNLLGYAYQTTGTVVHGLARGRELGYRTANIDAPHHTYVPGIGIYVVQMTVQGQTYGGMASVGRNVTFEPDRPVTVEINLFDFDGDIYGEDVTVTWHHYLRGEVKFSGAAALVDQLGDDERQSRAYLAEHHLNQ